MQRDLREIFPRRQIMYEYEIGRNIFEFAFFFHIEILFKIVDLQQNVIQNFYCGNYIPI